jgi:hypothetical protein
MKKYYNLKLTTYHWKLKGNTVWYDTWTEIQSFINFLIIEITHIPLFHTIVTVVYVLLFSRTNGYTESNE